MTNGIFIGRFQPAHAGHISAIRQAAKQCDSLLVLVGSANQCPSIKNPFSYIERVSFLQHRLSDCNNVYFAPLNDYRYNHARWINDVVETANYYFPPDNITIFGHQKEGNDYLSWFPSWKYQNIESEHDISGTQVRDELFYSGSELIPATVRADWTYYRDEQRRFYFYPFPATLNFNCADSVVTCLGHVLLIQRKFSPGKGAWALPGGFKNADETFEACALRELREETNLRVSPKVLRGSIKTSKLYDDPTRSFGIPRNTMAYHIDIAPDADGSLPRANGTDDASEAKWVLLSDVMSPNYQLYDDHRDIISDLTGIYQSPAFPRL